MSELPFLKPNLVKTERYLPYLKEMEDSRVYSNYGSLNTRFEHRMLHEYFNGKGAVTTVSSATSGLLLGIAGRFRPKGKYALMPSFTFSATPLAAMWNGLEPFFIDVNPNTWCMDERLLFDTVQRLGDQVAVVVPYATFGTDMDLTPYVSLERKGVPVVVDAAASIGTENEKGQFGIGFPGLVVFSLHATKCFGIGEGGLVYSADPKNIQRIRQSANFGFDNNRETNLIGMNAKLSEFAAAVALATLDVFPEKRNRRKILHDTYLRSFEEFQLTQKGWVLQKERGKIAYPFLSVLCPKEFRNLNIMQHAAANHIQTRTYFSPSCHQQTLFRYFPTSRLRETEEISDRIINLPLWEEMRVTEIRYIVEVLSKYA